MLSLAFDAGAELLALVGPSGCGKSMALRAIAGVYQPDGGSIELLGQPVFNAALGINRPPNERRIGYVPQNFALFPHLSVADNVAFPLRRGQRELRAEASRRVE